MHLRALTAAGVFAIISAACSTPPPPVSAAPPAPASPSAIAAEHDRWLQKCIADIGTLKVGSTRTELLKLFVFPGGLYNRTWSHYEYRDCRYILIDVEFAPVGHPGDDTESPEDTITKISQPYLGYAPVD